MKLTTLNGCNGCGVSLQGVPVCPYGGKVYCADCVGKLSVAIMKFRDCERRALEWILAATDTFNQEKHQGFSPKETFNIAQDARLARAEIARLEKGDAHADRSNEG